MVFVIEIPDSDSENMNAFQELMDKMQDETNKQIASLAKEKELTIPCAMDVWYLRTRSRWTEEKEAELIQLHKEGNPPNMGDF